MNKLLYIVVVLALLALSGCVTTKYTFNGESYRSSPDALAAQKVFLDKLLAEIKSRDNTIDAKVLVVTPAASTIEALGIKRTGTPKQEQIDFMTQFTVSDQLFFVDALKKSKLFKQVESRVAEHTLKEARLAEEKYSAVIYFHLVSPTQGGWYLIKSGIDAPTQINSDAIAKGAPRIESWIDSIESAYKKRG
ncbi:MAG: hypothetical protein IPJ38_02385 [Dechloromonas sp.]|jgi:hypothetical protein|uniref:Uncharacterized protein n=1 Tax=Candidatus Dechloromonas phosphorivorans TaxID=2899244 RepID=A0A935MPW2_9RHOO|nr:hypothetical protein [Candidatus Dechloromonas phosphorivorans]